MLRRIELGGEEFSIGRGTGNDLHFRNPWLSRVHARILERGDGFFLVDAGSRNGTYLNGQPIVDEQSLRDGDIIALGDIVLRFLEGQSSVLSALQVAESNVPLPPNNTLRIASQDLSFQTYSEAYSEQTKAEVISPEDRLLPALTKAASVLIGHHSLENLIEQTIDLSLEAVGAERAALLLRPSGRKDITLSGRGEDLRVMTERGFQGEDVRISRTLIEEVLHRRQAVLTVDAMSDNRFEAADSIMMEGIRSIICVPLWNDAMVTGLLYLDHRVAGSTFSEMDLRVSGLIANLAAVKIENVRLLEQQLEKERMAEQLQLAAKIQKGLLPSTPPRLEGYELCGETRSCFEVGGDYYDFIVKDDGKLAVVIADISGKGVAAALLMAVLQASLRALIRAGDVTPAVLMEQLNLVLAENSPANKFATIFYAELDPRDHVLEYVLAGHNPPLLLNGSLVEELKPCGPVVGLVENVSFRCRRVDIGPGSVLLLYTDGIIELEAELDDEFGVHRLSEILKAHGGRTGEELIGEVRTRVDDFAGEQGSLGDDATVVVLRRLSPD